MVIDYVLCFKSLQYSHPRSPNWKLGRGERNTLRVHQNEQNKQQFFRIRITNIFSPAERKYSLSWQWRRICLCDRSAPFRSALIASCKCFFYWLRSSQHFFPPPFTPSLSHICVFVCVCVCVCGLKYFMTQRRWSTIWNEISLLT